MMWWNPNTGFLYIWYEDGDSGQWVQISGPVGATGPVGPMGPAGGAINTALDVATTMIPLSVGAIYTHGYNTPGDGGGAHYKRASFEPPHAGKLLSHGGAWWELAESVVTLEMFGATGLAVAYDGTALINAIGYLNTIGGGMIYCMANRVYHMDYVGVVGDGIPTSVPVRINLNGATWKRPNGVISGDWRRMIVFSLDNTLASIELFGGTIDANYTGNVGVWGSADIEHCNSIFVWSKVMEAASVHFHDLILLDRWNFDHLGLYADPTTSLNRATFERITSESAQAITLRSDIIWSRHIRSVHIDNCSVDHIESEMDLPIDYSTDAFISNTTIKKFLDIAGKNSAAAINGYNVYCNNLTSAKTNFIRCNVFDENCDFGTMQGMSPGKWRSKDSIFRFGDAGFPSGSASTNTGQYVELDWHLIRPKFRLNTGVPQTVTNNAFGFPAWQVGIHQQYYITLEEPDFLDNFGLIGTPNGHVKIIRPKCKQFGVSCFLMSGTTNRLVDTTIEGGDYSQCVGTPIRFSGFVTAGYKLTLLGDWFGTEGRWSTTGSAHNPIYIENHRRIFHTANPDSAILGDELHLVSPVPSTGVITRIAGPSLVAAQTWRAGIFIVNKDVTANRPTLAVSDIGVMHLDTTLDADGKPIWWTGTAWVDATGAVV
jgi:hypothetical protein